MEAFMPGVPPHETFPDGASRQSYREMLVSRRMIEPEYLLVGIVVNLHSSCVGAPC